VADNGAPLLGRNAELDLLSALARRVADGQCQVALIEGEAGIGKTRLTGEFIRRLDGNETVLTMTCRDLGDNPIPLLPLVEMLGKLHSRIGHDRADEIVGQVPDLLPLATSATVGTSGPDDLTPTRLYAAVLDLLSLLAATGPVVLLLEDVHWADDSTLHLLLYLANALEVERVLVIGTLRANEPRDHPVLRSTLAGLGRLEKVRRIALGRLDRASVDAMAAHLLGYVPTSTTVTMLMRRGGGNPFFIEQLVAASADGDDTLPERLEQLLLGRVERMPPVVLHVLHAAAVAVPEASIELLTSVTGATLDVVEDSVRAATDAGVLRWADDGAVEFRHALLAEAVERSLAADERRELHRRTAEHLHHRRSLAGREPDPAQLARHWRAAGDANRAFVSALEAAQLSGARHAAAAVHHHLVEALELWPDVDEPAAIAHASRHELLLRASEAARTAFLASASIDLARRALDSVERGDLDQRVLATTELTRAHLSAGQLAAARSVIDGAMRELVAPEQRPPIAASLELELRVAQIAVLIQAGEYQLVRDVGPGALELAERLGADERACELSNWIGSSASAMGEFAAGLPIVRRARQRARELGAVDAYGTAAFNEQILTRFLEPAGAILPLAHEAVEALAAHPSSSARRWQMVHRVWVAETLYRLGRWSEADDVLEHTDREGFWIHNARIWVLRGSLALDRGDLVTAGQYLDRPELDRAIHFPLHVVPTAIGRARLAIARGNAAEALELATSWFDTLLLPNLQQRGHEFVAVAAEATAVAGDRSGRAASMLATVDHAVAQLVDVELPTAPTAWRAVAIAWLSVARGDHAGRAWGAAIEALNAAELGFEAARGRLCAAAALLDEGQRRAAATRLAEAYPVLLAMSAEPLLDELQELTRRTRVRVPGLPSFDTEQSPTRAVGLSDRELEVLALVADGLTNNEIGAQLFISNRTAGVHVSNVLRKLHVDTRRQAGRVARELRLVPG
jgi:DNA-binding CsgD family transcriptional regulator